ncbi:MAG: hypothetical protein V1838_02505 [Patescibacteria group bacterium]
MGRHSLEFGSAIAINFDDPPNVVNRYFSDEFTVGWKDNSSATPLATITFGKVPHDANAYNLGSRAGAIDGSFYITDPHRAKIAFDFSHFDRSVPLSVTAEPAISPHFLAQFVGHLYRALAPRQQAIFIHASGFALDQAVVLLPAWAHTGKTNTLLAYLLAGASFYGDDWCLLSQGKLIPYIKRLNLFGYNFKLYPTLRNRLSLKTKGLFHLTKTAATGLRLFERGLGAVSRFARELGKPFKNHGHVRIGLHEIIPGTTVAEAKPISHIFLLQKSSGPIGLAPITLTKLISQMLACHEYERAPLREWYLKYCFLFPDRRSSYLDGLRDREELLMKKQLAGIKTFTVSVGDGQSTETIRQIIKPKLG